jgi:membrane associated rhomboid family serine protease
VAHFAHLGGMAGGALVMLMWRTRRPNRLGPY